MANIPRRTKPILSKTWLFHMLASLPLGFDTETSLLLILKCQPKGVPDRISHDPTDALHQQKPFILLELNHLQSHQSKSVLTHPRA